MNCGFADLGATLGLIALIITLVLITATVSSMWLIKNTQGKLRGAALIAAIAFAGMIGYFLANGLLGTVSQVLINQLGCYPDSTRAEYVVWGGGFALVSLGTIALQLLLKSAGAKKRIAVVVLVLGIITFSIIPLAQLFDL